jgi:hypothetical protein
MVFPGLRMLVAATRAYEAEHEPGCTSPYWHHLLRCCTQQLAGAEDAPPTVHAYACSLNRALPVLLYMYLRHLPPREGAGEHKPEQQAQHAAPEHDKKLVEAAVKLILEKPVVPGYGARPAPAWAPCVHCHSFSRQACLCTTGAAPGLAAPRRACAERAGCLALLRRRRHPRPADLCADRRGRDHQGGDGRAAQGAGAGPPQPV